MTLSLTITAGSAFGDGQHESTRAIMELLPFLSEQRHRFGHIADIGCGSGVLAILAAHLWPEAQIIASDIAQTAVDTAKANAAENGVAERIHVVRADGMNHPEIAANAPYDLVMANILAEPLVTMADDFATKIAPDGMLVLSGILMWQAPQVLECYQQAGFAHHETLTLNNWRTLVLVRE